jgi:hypothetical protein
MIETLGSLRVIKDSKVFKVFKVFRVLKDPCGTKVFKDPKTNPINTSHNLCLHLLTQALFVYLRKFRIFAKNS